MVVNKTENAKYPSIPLVYIIHASNLFGTERMALETLDGFRGEFRPILLCPAGPIVEEAVRRALTVRPIKKKGDLFRVLLQLFRKHTRLVLMTTAVSHVLVAWAINTFLRRKVRHLHLVHGGADEHNSYGRKKLLNRCSVTLVAVSPFVKEKLIAHGVQSEKIRVVGNFLTHATLTGIRRRQPFLQGEAPKKGIVISRVIPSKRVDLLFDTLENNPDLATLSFVVFGLGGQVDRLRERAEKNRLSIELPGFSANLNERIAEFDFLLHLCPEEPFGLVVLEAMAAGIPVLAPDQGGVLSIVEDGKTGLFFKANDPDDLAKRLRFLSEMPAETLNEMTQSAYNLLSSRFSCDSQIREYRALIGAVDKH